MGFVITVAQRKGGSGKTTLAAHLSASLAARGLAVTAIDLDEQQSFSTWARRRMRSASYPEVMIDEERRLSLRYRLAKAATRAHVVVIDTPPVGERLIEEAMRAADVILAPMQLSPLDLDASLPTARMIGDSLKPGLFVINRAPPRARVADLIREKIRECRLPVARSELGARAAYAESMVSGGTAGEFDPHGAAAMEIALLADQVVDLAGVRLRPRAA